MRNIIVVIAFDQGQIILKILYTEATTRLYLNYNLVKSMKMSIIKKCKVIMRGLNINMI